ncbi:MAG: hypothetical protein M3Z32_05330, partial [Acidobacteriota bacterium]|nr:hypothetical protein [Acidobacteriota bacterium]
SLTVPVAQLPILQGERPGVPVAQSHQRRRVIDSGGQRAPPLGRSRDKMGVSIMNATEPVYMELVDFVARGSSAEQVANFRPSPEAQKRVAELLKLQRESELTEEETAELDGFVQLEHILGLARAKAQLILATRS